MLTHRQSELLIYLDRHLHEHGICPSYDEMRVAIGLHSKSGIHRLITALEERKFIRRLPNRARAIEIMRMPPGHNITSTPTAIAAPAIAAPAIAQDNLAAERGTGGTGHAPFAPTQVTPRRQSALSNAALSNAALSSTALARSAQAKTTSLLGRDGFSVPYFGKIAAGTPIEALRNEQDRVMLPPQFVGSGEFYALRVEGESMIEDGIMDGDIVVIKASNQAETGQIVVALVDEAEVTLKHFRRRANMIALEPANRNYETQIFSQDRVKIQGVLVGLMRQY
ncbi:MAG: transcriptional repressor LexA [Candidatus Symbiobacter sp.]|nr:transcriptional repressor LexA [Candidatus Symbiobacter sp.]